MKVLAVEIVPEQFLRNLCRDAMRERKQRRESLLKMSPCDVLAMDFSSLKATLPENETEMEQPALLASPGDQVGAYEDLDGVKLLRFAGDANKPVLTKLSSVPSKAFEARLRQSAKTRNLSLRFVRLIGNYVVVQVRHKTATIVPELRRDGETLTELDVNFLKRLGIKA